MLWRVQGAHTWCPYSGNYHVAWYLLEWSASARTSFLFPVVDQLIVSLYIANPWCDLKSFSRKPLTMGAQTWDDSSLSFPILDFRKRVPQGKIRVKWCTALRNGNRSLLCGQASKQEVRSSRPRCLLCYWNCDWGKSLKLLDTFLLDNIYLRVFLLQQSFVCRRLDYIQVLIFLLPKLLLPNNYWALIFFLAFC